MADENSTLQSSVPLQGASEEFVVNFDEKVINKIKYQDNDSWGFLLGGAEDGKYSVFQAMKCVENLGHPAYKFESDTTINKLLVHLPYGIGVIGAYYFNPKSKSDLFNFFVKNAKLLNKNAEDFLMCKVDERGATLFEVIKLGDGTSWETESENVKVVLDDSVGKEWLKNKLVIRLKAELPCQITVGKTSCIQKECERILHQLRSGSIALISESSDVFISKEQCQDTLDAVLHNAKDKSQENQVIEFKLLRSMSASDGFDSDIFCPALMISSSEEEYLQFTLDLDVILLVDNSCKVDGFMTACVDSLCNQAKFMILSSANSGGGGHLEMKAFHFWPDCSQHMITVVYPHSDTSGKNIPDEDLLDVRKTVHEMFYLPEKMPLLMKHQQFFSQSESPYLINPHVKSKSGIDGGISALVEGKYAYHHYMQDRFNDDGWGCAYRSLQTICSWFKLQGFTDKNVPSHREIQETLVAVGDKPKNFIGSRQWIGSFEVSICLEQLMNVSSKILHVSSGAEMAYKGRELLDHFQSQGTPVMIGGGVLAHTILGVHFDDKSGNIKFLILDPHYTGAETLKVILDKGWCGWKGPKFWDQTAHYNMCLPQRSDRI